MNTRPRRPATDVNRPDALPDRSVINPLAFEDFGRAGQPKLLIARPVLDRIWMYTELADLEVSGMGLVEPDGPNLLVTELYLFEQEGTGASTELDPLAIGRLMTKMLQRGEDTARLRFWWHSHCQIGCRWSGTDEMTISRLVEGGQGWLVSYMTNQRGDSLARLDLFPPAAPVRVTLHELVVEPTLDRGLLARCQAELEAKVTRRLPPSRAAAGQFPKQDRVRLGAAPILGVEATQTPNGRQRRRRRRRRSRRAEPQP